MAVVNSESGLMRQLYEAARSISQVRRLVRSVYGDARSRAEDGYNPSDIQSEMQARLSDAGIHLAPPLLGLLDVVAADLAAINFRFQSSYDAALQGGANQLQVMTDAYYDAAGSYSGYTAIQPKFEGVSWYHASSPAFQGGDIIHIENSEDASNDGTYTVDAVANVAASATNHVHTGDMASATTGSNLVTNGGFASDIVGWAGANWAWDAGGGAGVALHTAGSTAALTQAGILTIGKNYRIVFQVIPNGAPAGGVTPTAGTATGTQQTAASTYTEHIICAGSTDLTFVPTNDFNGAIDNVTVYEAPWNVGSGTTAANLWVISGSVATKTAGVAADLYQPIGNMVTAPTGASLYHLIFTVARTAGTVTAKLNSDADTNLAISAAGTYNLVCTYLNAHGVKFSADAAFAGTVTNVYLFPFRGICLRALLGADNNDDESMKITLYQR